MDDQIEIPVTYKNKELLIKGSVIRFGYVQHLVLDIEGQTIKIERDEEGQYRAIGELETMGAKEVDLELIRAVIEVLEGLD